MVVNACGHGNHTFCGHSLVRPIELFNGRIVKTFHALPADSRILEVAKRIAVIIIAPLAYVVLGSLALIGLALNACSSQPTIALSKLAKKQKPAPLYIPPPSCYPSNNRQENLAIPAKKTVSETIVVKPIQPKSVPLKPGVIELHDGNIAVHQYDYPVKGSGTAVGCTFFACEAILHINQNFSEVCKKFAEGDSKYFIQMQKNIIDNGLEIRKQALANKMEDNSIFPEELPRFTGRYNALVQDKVDVIPNLSGSLNEQLDRLFTPSLEGKHKFTVVLVDGQTISFLAIDNLHAFRFDSHKSAFAVVTKAEAKSYIVDDLLHGDAEMIEINFYHGEI